MADHPMIIHSVRTSLYRARHHVGSRWRALAVFVLVCGKALKVFGIGIRDYTHDCLYLDCVCCSASAPRARGSAAADLGIMVLVYTVRRRQCPPSPALCMIPCNRFLPPRARRVCGFFCGAFEPRFDVASPSTHPVEALSSSRAVANGERAHDRPYREHSLWARAFWPSRIVYDSWR